MKTKKLTKNSYRRKIILFAVFVFVSISLISTGFAAWVLSSNSHDDASGNVEVGVVKDGSLKVEITNKTTVSGYTFYFEPKEGDNTGRVRVDKDDPKTEQLSLTIEGKINRVDILSELSYVIELPEGVKEAANKSLIVLPDGVTDKVVISKENISEDGSFSFAVTFKWGSVFKGMNPSLYYDSDEDGLSVSDEDVQKTLEDLRAYVYGYYSEFETGDRATVIESHKADALPIYKITINAVAN